MAGGDVSVLTAAVAPIDVQVLGGRARAVASETRTRQAWDRASAAELIAGAPGKVDLDQVAAARLVLAEREVDADQPGRGNGRRARPPERGGGGLTGCPQSK